MKTAPILVCLAFLASACSSSLLTFDAQERPTKGVPVRTPVLVEVERVITYKLVTDASAMARYCTPDTTITLEFLPVGEQFFVGIDPAELGKAEFSVELTDAGALKKVTMGSDPGTAAAVEAATGLVSAVLPFIAAPKQVADVDVEFVEVAESANELKAKHCAKIKTAVTAFRKKSLD